MRRRISLLALISIAGMTVIGYRVFVGSRPVASTGTPVQPAKSDNAGTPDHRRGPSAGVLAATHVAPIPDGVDARIRIPANTDDELARMAHELALDRNQTAKTKKLLEAFDKAQQILQRYPEPSRSENRVRLQHQFRLAMHTVLPKDKESVLDEYLQRSR